jgi:CshA-type fibril repeat protein
VIEVTEDNKTGETGKPVTLDVLANDKGEKPLDPTSVMIMDKDGNPVTELVVENEGIWSVDPITGAITFTPEDGFKENPTPITYIVKDEDGKTSEPAKVVVNYPLQLRADVRSNIPLHTPVTVDVLTNDTKEPLNEDTVKIVGTNNAGDSLVVKGEGTWSVVNGKIIFTPEDGFDLDPSDIQYTVENMDGVERTAVTVTVNYVSKARPDVKLTDLAEPVTVPVLENDNGDLNVSTVKIVLPENFMSENPNAKLSADGKELIVPEQGTWKVNADGTITYKAEEGRAIVDPTPISYSVQDKSGKLLNTDALVTLNQTVVAGESDTNCSNVCDTYEDNVGVFQGFSSLLMMLFALFFGFMSIRKEKF